MLQDHGYRDNASCDVPVYLPAFFGVVYVAEVLVVIQYNVLVVVSGYTRSVVVYREACTK